jgi:hypothetical protein
VPGGWLHQRGKRADRHVMRERRQADAGQPRFIACRECFEPLELDQERMQRLGGRTFIECGACRNLIWIRRSDIRHAGPLAALGAARAAQPPKSEAQTG